MFALVRTVLISSYCLLLILISFQGSSQGSLAADPLPKSNIEFRKEVKALFEELSLNDAPLSIINVELANYPSGIAFAHFLPETQKKCILINYNYLYRKLGSDTKFSSNWKVIVVAILAHEWAHHYLGHTFEKANILNERNADIIAGRILAEYFDLPLVKSKGYNYNHISILKDFFSELPKGRHHLAANVRKDMVEKGAVTHRILESNLELLIANYEKQIKEEVRRNDSTYTSQINSIHAEGAQKYESLVHAFKDTVSTFEREVHQTLYRISDNAPPIDSSNSTNQQIKLILIAEDPTSIVEKKFAQFNLADSLLKKLDDKFESKLKMINDTVSCRFLKIEEYRDRKIKNLNSQKSSSVSSDKKMSLFTTEGLYNKLYIAREVFGLVDVIKLPENEAVHKVYLSEPLRRGEVDSLSYSIKGNITFKLKLRYKGDNCCPVNGTVEIKQGTNQVTNSELNISKDCKGAFPYSFEIKNNDTFYFDKYFHLWSKTIAAKSVDNKLFLQVRNSPSK